MWTRRSTHASAWDTTFHVGTVAITPRSLSAAPEYGVEPVNRPRRSLRGSAIGGTPALLSATSRVNKAAFPWQRPSLSNVPVVLPIVPANTTLYVSLLLRRKPTSYEALPHGNILVLYKTCAGCGRHGGNLSLRSGSVFYRVFGTGTPNGELDLEVRGVMCELNLKVLNENTIQTIEW